MSSNAADIDKSENPYQPPNPLKEEGQQKITSMDEVMIYARKHENKSLLCHFLCKLHDKHEAAAEYFLFKAAKGMIDDIPVALKGYMLDEVGNMLGRKLPVKWIDEIVIFQQACEDMSPKSYARKMNRRIFMGYATALSAGLTAVYSAPTANKHWSEALKGNEREKNGQDKAMLEAGHNISPTVDDFKQFQERCDKKLWKMAKSMFEQPSIDDDGRGR